MIKKIRAIIVDDETDGREVLQLLLNKHAPQITIIGQADSAEKAHQLIDELAPDLVFLDIQLSGKSGFSILEHYPNINFEVIFVTSYDQYSLTAIKFNALDYLLKPIDVDELKLAANKALHRIGTRLAYEERIKNLLENLAGKNSPKKMAVHRGDSVHMIDLEDILYIEAAGNYCKVTTSASNTYMVSRMLKEFEEYFGTATLFMRINKSTLANPLHIIRYSKGEPCIVTMKNEAIFEVSRRKKQEILDQLKMKR